jgi:hypothetical protein
MLTAAFLIVHGLLHLGVWVAPAAPGAPFDARHSWLLGDVSVPARTAAILACALLVVAGLVAAVGGSAAAHLAAVGAGVSLVLALATYHPWLTAAVVIDAAILVAVIA